MKENCPNNVCEVASSCDCTGLIPSLPESEQDIENYSDIIPIPDCEVKK